jgi:hypothetical protein
MRTGLASDRHHLAEKIHRYHTQVTRRSSSGPSTSRQELAQARRGRSWPKPRPPRRTSSTCRLIFRLAAQFLDKAASSGLGERPYLGET